MPPPPPLPLPESGAVGGNGLVAAQRVPDALLRHRLASDAAEQPRQSGLIAANRNGIGKRGILRGCEHAPCDTTLVVSLSIATQHLLCARWLKSQQHML